jgi:hypothetical protein
LTLLCTKTFRQKKCNRQQKAKNIVVIFFIVDIIVVVYLFFLQMLLFNFNISKVFSLPKENTSDKREVES